ncbi:MAG: hypothetical protein WBW04_02130 [Nitrolancea sp.]
MVDWRRLATPKLMASVAVLLVGLLVLGRTDLSAAEVPPGVPATSEQTAEIASLLRRQERAVFNSLTTGAMTDFPTIFYNDPTIPLGDGSKSAIAQVGTKAIDETMAELTPGPAGGRTGMLSAQIAAGIERQHELADMRADGSIPPSPLSPSDWVDVPFDVFDVLIQGNHATAKLAYGSHEQSEVIDQFTFTQVQGQWYISGVQTMNNPNLRGQQSSSQEQPNRR